MLNENVMIALKYAGIMIFLLALVFAIAIITPKIAKLIDKLISKIVRKDKTVNFNENDDIYKVRGIYDAQYHSSAEENDEMKNNNGDDNNNG